MISHQWKDLRAKEIEKITFSASLDTSESVQMLLVDIISPTANEIQVGIMCPSKDIELEIPKNLGQVQLAIFIDNNNNGPSADDIQTLSKQFDISDKNISLGKIPISDTPITFYNFKKKD